LTSRRPAAISVRPADRRAGASPREDSNPEARRSALALALADQGSPGRGPRRGTPVTASDYVAERIREGIGKGLFPLGSRLDQQVLAEQMGVSIIPVREALRRLQSDGLVHIFPRRGAFVAELTAAELTEIGWIRERLEELALRLAAPHLTPAKLDRLEKQAERMMQLAKSCRPEQWFELNREWHFTIYDAGKTWVLSDMIRTLWDRSRPYRVGRMAHLQNRLNAVSEHREIIGYLRTGDVTGAARCVRHHIRNAARRNLADATFRSGDAGSLGSGHAGDEG
jgi:DNA-binding GntR family transcriptional regulator